MGAERERIERFGRGEIGLGQAGSGSRWGPDAGERQRGMVREDDGADGDAWTP